MRPSQRLGGVVLLLLSTSGCAGIQSRMMGPRKTRRKPPRVAPRAGSDRDSGRGQRQPRPARRRYRGDTRRRYGPTHRARGRHLARTTILRAFATLSDARESGSWQENGLGRRCLPHPRVPFHTSRGRDESNDRQVRPVSGDEAAKGASTRRQAARTKAASTAQGNVPALLPSPIAVRVPVKLHDRPASRGAVALEVEPADQNEGDGQPGEPARETSRSARRRNFLRPGSLRWEPARNRRRQEAYLIATAASAADLTTTGGTSRPSRPHPARGRLWSRRAAQSRAEGPGPRAHRGPRPRRSAAALARGGRRPRGTARSRCSGPSDPRACGTARRTGGRRGRPRSARSGARGGSGWRTPRRPCRGRRSRGPWSARPGPAGADRGRGPAIGPGRTPRAARTVGSRSTVCTSAWCRMPPNRPPGIRMISGVWISSS